jgi:hypothetical protein
MPDIVTNVLYQDIDRLQEKVKELEAERDAAQGEVERLRVAIEAGVYLADFVAGERDMDKCEDCQVSECCSCCVIVAGRFLKKVPHDVAMEIAAKAQEAFGGKP